MSHNVAVVCPPVPLDDSQAWAAIDAMIDAKGEVPEVFRRLLSRLTGRYPCICDLDDDHVDDGVWSDGPLVNNLGHRASVLGMVYSRSDEVLPFLIAEANALGLLVFDWESETIHRPSVRSEGERPSVG